MERLRQRADFLAAATGAKGPRQRIRAAGARAARGWTGAGRLHGLEEGRQLRSSAIACGGGCARSCGWRREAPDAAGTRLCADRPARGARTAVRPADRGFRRARSAACTPRSDQPAELAGRPPPHMRARGRAPDMTDQKNTILAIVLSAIVLIGWQYFVGLPQMEKQKQEAQLKAQQQQQQQVQTRPAARPARRPAARPARRAAAAARPRRRAGRPASSCRARRCSSLAARRDRDAAAVTARSRSRARRSTISR